MRHIKKNRKIGYLSQILTLLERVNRSINTLLQQDKLQKTTRIYTTYHIGPQDMRAMQMTNPKEIEDHAKQFLSRKIADYMFNNNFITLTRMDDQLMGGMNISAFVEIIIPEDKRYE